MLLTGCKDSGTADNSTPTSKGPTLATHTTTEVVKPTLDTSQFAVLKFDIEEDYVFKDVKPSSLSEDEIRKLETVLVKCIADFNVVQELELQKMVTEHPEIPWKRENYIVDLPKYKRQFFPVINSKGEKLVLVNCFCSAHDYWRKKEVIIYDGGNCYFRVKINPSKSMCYDLMANGSA